MEICINYNDYREWVELPADIEDIAGLFGVELEETTDFEEELTFEDIETDLDFRGHKLTEFNLDELNDLAECEDNYYDVAVAISEVWGLNEVDIPTCKKAVLYKVKDAEELGEALVNDGLFGPVPDYLMDYLDYEKIGESYNFDGDYTSTGFLFGTY